MDNDPHHDAADALTDALAEFHELLASGEAASATPLVSAGSAATVSGRLRADQQCLALIERVRRRYGDALAPLIRGDTHPDWIDAQDSPAAERRIGRFQIVRELGRGGHGVVLLAHDPVVGRDVALKVPRAESLFAPEPRLRFLREAQAAGRLTHPNIVPVYEVGQSGPVCYIANAYCSGPTLRDWLAAQSQGVPPSVAARIVSDLAAAVTYAHSQGVLHRDLKPSNVLLDSPHGLALSTDLLSSVEASAEFNLVPKLTDFGLAKLSESTDCSTRTGTVLGTPAYMAPEQADGRLAEVGPRTDVYGLGAILYELLAGRPPYRGASDADTLRQVVVDEPLSLRQLRRDVPRDLAAIAERCLEKRPDRRYATAAALADDLRRFLNGEATLARPLGLPGRAIKWARRHPTAASLIGATVVALVLAGIGGTWHLSQLSQALAVARQAEAESQRRERELQQHIYLGDLKLAHQAWRRCDVQQAVEILSRHFPKQGEPDIRGFLWRHLWGLCQGEPRTLSGHKGHVYHAAFSPDGMTLATGGLDRTIRLWDVGSGQLRGVLVGHKSEINSVAFSPDGAALASTDDLGHVHVWDTLTARESFILAPASDGDSNVAFTPDGRTLVSAGRGKVITLWDLVSRTVRATLEGHTDKVACVTVSDDGKWLASASTDETARLWDLATGEVVAIMSGHYQSVRSVAISHDSRLVATTGVDETVRLWKVPTGEPLAVLRGHRQRISSVAFSADDKFLISAGEDQSIRWWDVESGSVLGAYHGRQGRIWCLASSPRENLCATTGADGTVKLWSIGAGKENSVPSWLPQGEGHAVVGSTNDFAAISNSDGRCAIVDFNRACAHTLATIPNHAIASLMRRENRLILALFESEHGDIELWDATTSKTIARLHGHLTASRRPAFDATGTLTATGGGEPDHTIRLWEVATSQLLQILNGPSDTACLAFSPDGRLLAAAGDDSVVRLWDLNDPHRPAELRGHSAPLRDVAFSPDGTLLASASGDSTVRLWDVQRLRDVGLTLRHPGWAVCAAFCPDEPILATSCADGVVRLWNLYNGEQLAEFRGHDGDAARLAFTPDGRWLVSAAYDQTLPIMLWSAAAVGDRAAPPGRQ